MQEKKGGGERGEGESVVVPLVSQRQKMPLSLPIKFEFSHAGKKKKKRLIAGVYNEGVKGEVCVCG